MNRVIIPTGYMGSGSSAITDLLDGIEGINVSRSTFEFVFLHCPNGVFDLEDKLLMGNNAVRSDEALHSFAKTMQQLYDKKYWWVGHYNKYVGKDFWKVTENYIRNLIEFTPEYYWYYQENVEISMVPRLVLNKILNVIPSGKKYIKKPLAYSPMWITYIEPKEFYKFSQEYIYKVFDMMGKETESIVLDQLLLPFNLFRFSDYFKEDAEVFVIERDPRDVFITNKYYWSRSGEPVPYPLDAEKFCDFYKKLRRTEKNIEHPQIHRFHFEDLIYKYEETSNEIFKILDIDENKIKNAKIKFNPDKSINNTQLFQYNAVYREECKIIEQRLEKYLYAFPYEIEHDEKSVF